MSSSSGRIIPQVQFISLQLPVYDLKYRQAKLVVTITVILTARKKELEILIGVSVVGNVAQWRRYRKFMLS